MVFGMTLAACGTEPPSDPSTPWMAAGCKDSPTAGVPDFRFNGIANSLNNSTAFDTGGGVLSEDGTCTGTAIYPGTVVRGADQAAAVAACATLGITVTTPAHLVDSGYNVPIDAWTCIDV